jgi:hypothetical protein
MDFHLINKVHIHAERPMYRCRWKGCDRNGNPLGNRSKIVEHLRTHTREQPFQCIMPGCLKRFTKKTSVVGHFKRYHAHEPMTDDLESHLRDMMRPDDESTEESHETLLYQTVSSRRFQTLTNSYPFYVDIF